MLGRACRHHPALPMLESPLPNRALGRRAAEAAPLLQLLPTKHPFLAALFCSFSCVYSAHLWFWPISSLKAENTALSHSCSAPASWAVTGIPQPNISIDKHSFHKQSHLLHQMYKHTRCRHIRLQKETYCGFPINLFCQHFKRLQGTWTSVLALLKLSCVWGCRWHARR